MDSSSKKRLVNYMKLLAHIIFCIFFVLFVGAINGNADEVNDLKVNGYLQMAYDKKSDIAREKLPQCSVGVEAIARAQNRAKLGTNEGISDALSIASKHIESSPSTWESDFLRLSLALNHAALGDFKSAVQSAEAALAKNDFNRLQVGSDPALHWLRENFGAENFSRSCQDHMHRVAAAYYMDHTNPPQIDSARLHIGLIANEKIRESVLKQLSYRESDIENPAGASPNKEKVSNEDSGLKDPEKRKLNRGWSNSYLYFGIACLIGLALWLYYCKARR